MSAPVVDHAKRTIINEITSKSPFSIFNIVAVVAILVVGYFLYKKFTDKFQKGSIKIPDVVPLPVRKPKPEPPVVEEPAPIPEPGTDAS